MKPFRIFLWGTAVIFVALVLREAMALYIVHLVIATFFR